MIEMTTMATLAIGTPIRYTGWLPPHVAPFVGIVVCASGAPVLVEVGGRMVWCDAKNLEEVK
jgi:hypothetical protein